MEPLLNFGRISRVQTDSTTSAEKSILTGLFRLALKNLKDDIQAGIVKLQPKDLLILFQLREIVAVDELDDIEAYFVKCGACLFDKTCSLYNEGSDCAFKLKNDLKSSSDIIEIMVQLLRIEGDRIQRSLLIEKKDSGIINRNVSAEIMQYFEMVKTLKEVMQEVESVTVKVTGKGAISKLFGDLIEKAKTQTIEACVCEEIPAIPEKEPVFIKSEVYNGKED